MAIKYDAILRKLREDDSGGGGGTPTAITVANEATDTTCFVAFFTAATGNLGPKTNANLTFNSSTGVLTLVAPVLGTPTSGTLTNCNGLPISTGVSGLAANVATFLATPSSANLLAAVTDETGTGALVFANTPTLVTPVLGVATATSINKVAITAPATSATLTLANGSTLATSGAFSITLTSTAGTNVTLPTTGTLATLAGAETFTNKLRVSFGTGNDRSQLLFNHPDTSGGGIFSYSGIGGYNSTEFSRNNYYDNAAADWLRFDVSKAASSWLLDQSGNVEYWTATGAENPISNWAQKFGMDINGRITTYSAINETKGADIASATTTDIGAATGNYIDVTGTTTITGLGTVQAGTRRIVRFTGILTLTHNATSLILPGGANITTAAGDVATFVSLGSGNWRAVNYTKADGTAIVGGGGLSWGTSVSSGTGTGLAMTTADAAADKPFITMAHTFSGTTTSCTTTQFSHSSSRTATGGTASDNFTNFSLTRTNVTNGANLTSAGTVASVNGSDTQTANTLTATYDLLQLNPGLRSTGSSLKVTVANSVVNAPTNGHIYAVIGNTQSVAQKVLNIDTGGAAVNHVAISIKNLQSADTPTTGAITLNTFSSATQAVGETVGIRAWQNFNTNSTLNTTLMFAAIEANSSSGINTGIYIRNNNTTYNPATTRQAGIMLLQGGVGGTVLGVQTVSNVNSSTNGLVNYTLSNTQSGATVMQKIDTGTSAQGHTGLLINAFGASTTQTALSLALSTGTGTAINITGASSSRTSGAMVNFGSAIFNGTSGSTYGIYFSQPITNSGSGTGTGYGISIDNISNGVSTNSYGYHINNVVTNGTGNVVGFQINAMSSTGTGVGKFLSFNNAQNTTLSDRTVDTIEVLHSRTNTATSSTVADSFYNFILKDTSIQNGAGGTLTSNKAVMRVEAVATQTAGTLTHTKAVAQFVQGVNTTGHVIDLVCGNTSSKAFNFDTNLTTGSAPAGASSYINVAINGVAHRILAQAV